ncbi:MAG: ABC transporter ATP-binding protein [Desulfobacterales bacterium]
MDQSSIILKLDDISFSYPGTGAKVLDHLYFTIRSGEKIGLIGPNGSGKSTLLHIIMGLLLPDDGYVEFLGQRAENEKDFRHIRRQVGLVFQNADDQLFSPTVLEDVAFGPLNMGKTPNQAREMSLCVLKELNLEGFENRITHKLSGGEKKLVALATVLVMEPKVLFLDEPSTGLDEKTRERIIDILNNLDITFVMVSHEYDYLVRTTQTIYTLNEGKIEYCCNSRDLHTHYHSHPAGRVPHEHVHD